MEEFESKLSLWFETDATLSLTGKNVHISIKCFNNSLSNSFLFIKDENQKTILLCLPISPFINSTVNDCQITFIIQGKKVFSLTFLTSNSHNAELIHTQITMSSFLSSKTDFSTIFPSQFITMNQNYLENNGELLTSMINISKPLPLIPFNDNEETIDIWKKRNFILNTNYFMVKKELKVTFMTWNVGQEYPEEWTSKEMSFIFQKDNADLIFIAIEEIDFGARAVIFGDSDRYETWNDIWTRSAIDFNYEPIVQQQFGSVYLIGLKRKNEDRFNISANVLFTTRFGISASKSAVAFSVKVDETNFVVVGSHLEAHTQNIETRNQQIHEICSLVEENEINNQMHFDYFILFGDLNYRIDYPYDETKFLVKANNIKELLAHDQLLAAKEKDELIKQFEEPEITFKPTYKFDDHSNEYDTSHKMRTPSYTDRILIKTSKPYKWSGTTDDLCFETSAIDVFTNNTNYLKENIISFEKTIDPNYPTKPVCNLYRSYDVQFSDHRPVVSEYTFEILQIDKEREKQFHDIETKEIERFKNIKI